MSTVQCVDCLNFKLREARAMAAHGFGLCAHKPTHHFESATRPQECDRFSPGAAEVVASRREWLSMPGSPS